MSSISSVGGSSISSVSMVDRGRVGGSSHNTNIVGVSSSIGVVDGEPSSNLSNGVGIGIRFSLSFTLAIVVPSISKVSNTSISNMSSIGTVTNSSNTADNTIRVVNTSYYTTMG